MYFHKIEHPYNFVFGHDHADLHQKRINIQANSLGSDIYRITAKGPGCDRWEKAVLETRLEADRFESGSSNSHLHLSELGDFTLSLGGVPVLKTKPDSAFGLCGKKWMFCFELSASHHFFGMGEKNIGFEKSGIRTKFWNTDVWGDFSDDDGLFGKTDPMYISIPYLLVQTHAESWVGILVHNPYPVFMDTGARQVIEGVKDTRQNESCFYMGSTDGVPDIFLIAGNSCNAVTTKLQNLSGKIPRPPLWSLGYHQSRWGYGSPKDLEYLDNKFTELGIPCDGLWLDIDYMDQYKIFTLDKNKFPVPAEAFSVLNKKSKRKVVSILDPGIKKDRNYAVCQSGIEKGLFCLTSEKRPYVGFVWPGASYFPDFSLEKTKIWWANETAELAKLGISAFWIDMNDPSTGSAELSEMLFSNGSLSHESYHNQYANGMAKAVHTGLLKSAPDKRPFILSRSGFIGINSYSAVWTGDNHSNYHHLRKAVEMELSLSLSGVPFAGSDIGGFGGDAEPENFIDWYKTCFLFPFFRNHSANGTVRQEPWVFGEDVLLVIRQYIKSRYAFMPYLYNLFIGLEKTGAPIVRPLIYEFPEYSELSSQFMVGDSVLQAPKLEEGITERVVDIPPGLWYEPYSGSWIKGSAEINADLAGAATPIYFREGSFIPFSRIADAGDPLNEIDFFAAVPEGTESFGSGYYECDSGDGFDYLNNKLTAVQLTYRLKNEVLSIAVTCNNASYSSLKIRVGIPVKISSATVEIRHSNGIINNYSCVFASGKLPLPGETAAIKISQIFEIN